MLFLLQAVPGVRTLCFIGRRHNPVDSRFDEVRKAFKTLRSLNLGLYFCVDFPFSSELIGYVDLTDSYEIWPKCALVINAMTFGQNVPYLSMRKSV